MFQKCIDFVGKPSLFPNWFFQFIKLVMLPFIDIVLSLCMTFYRVQKEKT